MLGGDNVLGDLDTIVADLGRRCCDVLAAAPRADLESLAGLLIPFAAPAGTVLLRRGDVAEHFLLLTSGRARVAVGEEGVQKVTGVAEGSILGEMALLRGTRRSATVTAMTQTRGLKGGQAAFTRLLAIPGVLEKVVIKARQRLAADTAPVPSTSAHALLPGSVQEVPRRPAGADAGGAGRLPATTRTRVSSASNRYSRRWPGTPTEIDDVYHFAALLVDSADAPREAGVMVRPVGF